MKIKCPKLNFIILAVVLADVLAFAVAGMVVGNVFVVRSSW
jgi:hypothetical protein